jgi:hypothetical protein
MNILAIFTENSELKTGLSPILSIYKLDTGELVIEDADMTELGDTGQYSYEFTAWDSAVDYSVICDSVTLTGSERYAYSSISSAPVIEDTLSSDDILRILLAKAAGTATGGGSSGITFKDVTNTKDRIFMAVNMNGDRSVVTLDGT